MLAAPVLSLTPDKQQSLQRFAGLLASLSFQKLQDTLLPTALRMTKR